MPGGRAGRVSVGPGRAGWVTSALAEGAVGGEGGGVAFRPRSGGDGNGDSSDAGGTSWPPFGLGDRIH